MAQTTISEALLSLAKVYNIDERAIAPDDTSAEIIQLIAGGIVFGSSNVTPSAPNGNTDYWGTKASEIQTSVAIANGKITGTLHKLTSGALVEGWGEGYFLALKFTKDNAKASSIKVGLRPSLSSGLVELDADMDGVFKITDKDAQDFEILCSDGNVSYSIILDLSELVLD